ncbi:hypothetical protein HDU83_009099 [Entophlyctis luteolus]|nr:hypothetical protein HDU83_009099 [Entophlyctis luteolus]
MDAPPTPQQHQQRLTHQHARRASDASDFTTIDWHETQKRAFERRAHAAAAAATSTSSFRLRFRHAAGSVAEGLRVWLVVFTVGVATALSAGAIDVVSVWLNDVKEGYCIAGPYLGRKIRLQLRRMDFMDGFSDTPMSRLHIILHIVCNDRFGFGWVVENVKVIGITLTVGSGLALGKEGPLIHIACCFGNIIAQLSATYRNNHAKRRHILTAAGAAGVSVAFGAPVGGVLFALEELAYYFPYKTMWRSFFCAMVGALVLKIVNPFRTGKLVWFEVKLSRRWHVFELPAFVLLGVLGGLLGSLFIRLNTILAGYRKRYWNERPILEVAVVALVTGLVGFSHAYLRVSTVDLVANLFRECADNHGDFHGMCAPAKERQVVVLLLFAAGIKFLLTVITFGTRIPAGVFTPTIAVGALFGRVLGIVMSAIQRQHPTDPFFTSCAIKPITNPCITPATYSIIGAAAFLAGTTRITVSLTVIMFELTGALSYVLPIMITVLVAKWVGDWSDVAIFPTESAPPGDGVTRSDDSLNSGDSGTDLVGRTHRGLYAALIAARGYPFLDPADEYLGDATVGDVIAKGVVALHARCAVRMAQQVIRSTRVRGFPVIAGHADGRVVGFVGRRELRDAIEIAKSGGNTDDDVLDFAEVQQADDIFGHARVVNVRQLVDAAPMTIPEDFPVWQTVEYFKKMGVRSVLVTTRENGVLKGILTRKDIIRFLASRYQ